jgi:hypothetical protein
MEYGNFLKLMLRYKKINEDISELFDIGVDLMDGRYKLSDNIYKLFETSIESVYGKEGLDWVTWFIFENDWGTKDWSLNPTYDKETGKIIQGDASMIVYGAVDKDGNPIAYSFESLYELLEKDYKLLTIN